MDLLITSLNGNKVMYEFPTDVATALCIAFPEKFSPYVKRTETFSATWQYSCQKLPSGMFALVRQKGAAVEYLTGDLKHVAKNWPDCPQHVIDAYAATRPSMRASNSWLNTEKK
jgi:hypothetical protein